MNWRMIRKTVRWLLLVLILLYILTGYGITEFRVVEQITFGLLTKSRAFIIHHYLVYPTAALLVLHVAAPVVLRLVRRRRKTVKSASVRVVKLVD